MMRWAVQATLVIVLSMFARSAHATSCAMPTPDNGDEFADVIFEAIATGDAEPGKARLSVTKVYKGAVPETVVAAYGGMKSYSHFETDQRYLVFGMVRDDGSLWVHLCGATHKLPAEGSFAEGAWESWSPVRRYGRPRPAGGDLASGKRPDHAPVDPQPDPPAAAPAEPAHPPATPKASGCAGCAVSRGANWSAWPALLMLVVLARRRRR